ncbi:VOC family protein [Streptomyces sp. NPDC093225]|uniref:VOC family protein n=1 Tax=Streptomyces sp. NPDC093225 TaxID=3366034 RepID=UPI0038144BED
MSLPQQPPHVPATATAATAAVQLNHTAVYATDRRLSAEFIAAVLGLTVAAPFGPFLPVDLGNGVTLDYYEKTDEPIQSQHYAFLVPEDGFDAAISRLEFLGVTYYSDPAHTDPGRPNTLFGGRGAYFLDPDGHNMEIMTVPYARP